MKHIHYILGLFILAFIFSFGNTVFAQLPGGVGGGAGGDNEEVCLEGDEAIPSGLRGTVRNLGAASQEVPVADEAAREIQKEIAKLINILKVKECLTDKLASEASRDQLEEISQGLTSEINEQELLITNPAEHELNTVNEVANAALESLEDSDIDPEIRDEIVRQLTEEHFRTVEQRIEKPNSQELDDFLERGIYTPKGAYEASRWNPTKVFTEVRRGFDSVVQQAVEQSDRENDRGVLAVTDQDCEEDFRLGCDFVTPAFIVEENAREAIVEIPIALELRADEPAESATREHAQLPQEAISGQGGVEGLSDRQSGAPSYLDRIIGTITNQLGNIVGGGDNSSSGGSQGGSSQEIQNLKSSALALVNIKKASEQLYKNIREEEETRLNESKSLLEDLATCYEDKNQIEEAQNTRGVIESEVQGRLDVVIDEFTTIDTIFAALADLETRINAATTVSQLRNLVLEAQTFNSHGSVEVFNATNELNQTKERMDGLDTAVQGDLNLCLGVTS